ncbi:serpin family protein [Fulvivirgaceae bacterium BMA12]|uniref:Serpin family protein n=1 Tax=Agaribacillus aureus TaxID=3051825 RepID=A0ABT8LCK7_9BACT|nr:serpin family protein [Fulvivirgaceae bacterium BMA12]
MNTILKSTQIFFAAISFSLLMSCNSSDYDQPEPEIRPLTNDEQEIVHASNEFAMNMLSGINATHEDQNVFISPFSISAALSMTLNGANGETNEAIKEAIGLKNLSDETINQSYKDLVAYIYGLDKGVTLNIANSSWYKQGLTILSSFEDLLREFYSAEVKEADFEDKATVDLINNWIENETNGKIKDMLDVIPPDAVMYLINAIYFKANWSVQFDPDKTANRSFTLMDGQVAQVPTMYANAVTYWSSYNSEKKLQLFDIPYGNGAYGFTIIMPDNPSAINQVASEFTIADMEKMLQDASESTLEAYLPKFKIEFKELLNDYLVAMGMGVAFTAEADLSRLFEEDLNLAISRVIHQSFLEVNEAGSEAAAATVVEIVETSLPPALRVDQPFIFFIRERNSNTILFSGKLIDPQIE